LLSEHNCLLSSVSDLVAQRNAGKSSTFLFSIPIPLTGIGLEYIPQTKRFRNTETLISDNYLDWEYACGVCLRSMLAEYACDWDHMDDCDEVAVFDEDINFISSYLDAGGCWYI
jgi:hypothetical protein